MANRYFQDPLPRAATTVLRGDLAHHLSRVLRVREGDELTLGDGRGSECTATVLQAARGEVELALSAHRQVPAPRLLVHLALATPRWQRAEWLFEHATEVGVSTFHPLATARSRPQGERRERWQKLCLAAAGQCDRAYVPDVREPRPLAEFLQDPLLPAHRLLAARSGERLQAPAEGAVVLLVGPEGGFDPQELQAIAAASFAPVRLGPHVLRTETAALLGAGMLLQ